MLYRRYVNDILALFSSLDHAYKFKTCLSSKHQNINFSIEKEKDGCLHSLDVNIFRKNEKFETKACRKKSSVWFIPTFKSFIPETHKIGLSQ